MRNLVILISISALVALSGCSKSNASQEKTASADKNKDKGQTKSNPNPYAPPKDVAAPPKDAKKTASGLAYKSLRAGTGTTRPTPTSQVTVHYTGWTTDGRMFDSSLKRGKPITFPLNRVIKGWTEGLQLMVTGEKMRFWIPAELAYGNNPRRGAPAGMLVFDVELISFK